MIGGNLLITNTSYLYFKGITFSAKSATGSYGTNVIRMWSRYEAQQQGLHGLMGLAPELSCRHHKAVPATNFSSLAHSQSAWRVW